MTKYVLNSGGIRRNPTEGKIFFDEVFKGIKNVPKLLICNFAQMREYWEGNFEEDKIYFKEIFGENVKLTLAMPEIFEQQIKECDAIYIHGGDDHLVQYWLKQFDLPKIWEGKVVATSSASSHALAESFWTCDWRKCLDGLGILPIKFLAHYDSEYGIDDPRGPIDWEKGYAELEKYGDNSLPIYALKEGEFIVFEK